MNETHAESSQTAGCLHCDQGLLYGRSCNQKTVLDALLSVD